MGTRGCFGFRLDGADIAIYNHFDSYPDSLGARIAQFVADKNAEYGKDLIGKLTAQVRAMIPIDPSKPASPLQARALAEFSDMAVASRQETDWYCLLRKTQGDVDAFLRAVYYAPGHEFLNDGLFCEHAYLINLDTGNLEYYSGFYKKELGPAMPGRYWRPFLERPVDPSERDNGYGAVVLHAEYPLAKITARSVGARVKAMVSAQSRTDRFMEKAVKMPLAEKSVYASESADIPTVSEIMLRLRDEADKRVSRIAA